MPIYEAVKQSLLSIVMLPIIIFNPFVMIAVVFIVAILIKRNNENKQKTEYESSSYYLVTKLPYRSVRDDTGRYGEYLTYKCLRYFENDGAKFLFNLYIPKGNGETTEIDVLMICSSGILVFESKNYSGWIFGSENQKNWYQTLPQGRGKAQKEPFYNPIMQNKSHIKHLKTIIGEQVPMRSIVVFSERCTLKNIRIDSADVNVINRNRVADVVGGLCRQCADCGLTESDILDIYSKLYPYTQVDAVAREKHIADIQNNLCAQPVQQTEKAQSTAEDETKTESAAQETTNQPKEKADSEGDTAAPAQEEISSPAPETQKCPKCGGNLVLRTAIRGANAGNRFYGCSNYPKCRYIQNITSQTSPHR